MNILEVSFFITAAILFSVEYEEFTLVFAGILLLYILVSLVYPGAKRVSNFRKIMFASWGSPQQGIIRAKVEVNVEKVLRFLDTYPEAERPTLNHIIAKAGTEVMKEADDLQGKIVFGKFLKFKSVNLGMILNLGPGRELVRINLDNKNDKTIEAIRDEINSKKAKAQATPPEQLTLGRFVPSFLMPAFLGLVKFITGDLNISLPFLGIKRSPFGAGMLHISDALDADDSLIPFVPYSGCSVQMTASKVCDRIVVEDGKPWIAKIMVANFVLDHRYLDGAKAKKMIPNFMKVFENPQMYSSRRPVDPTAPKSNEAPKQNA